MKSKIKTIAFDILQNTLHLKDCSYRSKQISEYFSKCQTQSETEFLFSIISYLIKVENNLTFEVCPHCL